MSHYFDESVSRGVTHHNGMPRLRRSSTARSIGARSDFDDDQHSANSVRLEDPERARERSLADTHMHSYISDQLNRYRDEDVPGNYEHDDEYEPKA
jgi:hypothetical protein